MKSTKLKVGALAMALVFAMSGSVFAAGSKPAGGTPGSPSDAEYKQNADTVFSIFESTQNAGNMSYTVPLYVTMAVSQGKADVSVPDNYGIINNSKREDNNQKMEIGVTGMHFEKLNNSYYKVYDADTVPSTTKDAIQLSIGGVKIPRVVDNGAFVDLTFADGTGGVFWNDTTHKPTPIAPSTALFQIPLVGKVSSSATRKDTKAAAQFRVKYNVSLLDASGNPMGSVYTGSDYHQAGLENWDENVTPTGTVPSGN